MITSVSGVLEARGPDWVHVRVGGGVSLQLHVPSSAIDRLGAVGEGVRLHTRLYIRDDEPVLYGFPTPEGLQLFQLLTGVSSIGPRTALAALSTLGTEALVSALATGDLESLGRVPGVGKKSAARLVLELKDRLDGALVHAAAATSGQDGDVVSALMALGYSANEARRGAEGTPGAEGLSLEERVRRALQGLAG